MEFIFVLGDLPLFEGTMFIDKYDCDYKLRMYFYTLVMLAEFMVKTAEMSMKGIIIHIIKNCGWARCRWNRI